MEMSTRWVKILKDLWDHKSRSVLVILSIAVGVGAVLAGDRDDGTGRGLPGLAAQQLPAADLLVHKGLDRARHVSSSSAPDCLS